MQVPLIDRWDTYCNDTSSTLALMANVFYEIKMEFKQVIGSAFVRLSWASASVTKELIPSSQFYYETQTQKSPFGIIISPNAASGDQCIASGGGERAARSHSNPWVDRPSDRGRIDHDWSTSSRPMCASARSSGSLSPSLACFKSVTACVRLRLSALVSRGLVRWRLEARREGGGRG